MSKTISLRIDDDLADFYKDNSDEIKPLLIEVIKKIRYKKKNARYRKVKFYIDTKFEEKNEVSALEVFNRFRIDEIDLIKMLEQYAFENDEVILCEPDDIDNLPLNKILNLVKLKKRGETNEQ